MSSRTDIILSLPPPRLPASLFAPYAEGRAARGTWMWGQFIAQDVTRINHRPTVSDLIRKGRHLEQLVFADAVQAHLDHRVLVYTRKTVVFE